MEKLNATRNIYLFDMKISISSTVRGTLLRRSLPCDQITTSSSIRTLIKNNYLIMIGIFGN